MNLRVISNIQNHKRRFDNEKKIVKIQAASEYLLAFDIDFYKRILQTCKMKIYKKSYKVSSYNVTKDDTTFKKIH